jgi:hypothetical protein
MNPFHTAEGANRLFRSLQGQAGLFDLDGATKTAFALEM